MHDVVLSDGTRIPKGTLVGAATSATHADDALYGPNADAFDPFRFARLREQAGTGAGAGLKYEFAYSSPDYAAFGYGRHVWCVDLSPSGCVRRVGHVY